MANEAFKDELTNVLRNPKENPVGAELAEEFLIFYTVDNAFGKAGKRNADVFLIHLMVKYGIINMSTADAIYEAARKLQIRESYLRSLYYDAQMMFDDDDPEKRCNELVRLLFINSKRPDAFDNNKLIVSVEDQMLRNYIKAKASTYNSWSDSSFNSNIIKIPIKTFIEITLKAYDDAPNRSISADIYNCLINSSEDSDGLKNALDAFNKLKSVSSTALASEAIKEIENNYRKAINKGAEAPEPLPDKIKSVFDQAIKYLEIPQGINAAMLLLTPFLTTLG